MYNIYRKFKTTIKQRWIIKDNPPENPDCFIIPSYALVDRNTPTRPTRAEIKLAISWWQKFPQSYLLMSTGDNQNLGIDNSKVMAAYAQRLGVRPHNILEENRSLTTYQNLLYSLEIIKKNNFLQPTLVTLDLYTPRAVATARKIGWEKFYWLSVYAKGQPAFGYKYIQTYSRVTIFCYEVAATVYSKFVGWI